MRMLLCSLSGTFAFFVIDLSTIFLLCTYTLVTHSGQWKTENGETEKLGIPTAARHRFAGECTAEGIAFLTPLSEVVLLD